MDPSTGLDEMEKRKSLTYRDSNSVPWVVQHVASRYSDCAIPVPKNSWTGEKSENTGKDKIWNKNAEKGKSNKLRNYEKVILSVEKERKITKTNDKAQHKRIK